MKKILYLGPSGIGDWCFIYPSLPALLKENNAQQADLILPYQNDGNELLNKNELIHSVRYLHRQIHGLGILSYLPRWLRLLIAVRKQRYHTVVISYLSNQPDMLLLARLSGAKKRIGIHRRNSWLEQFTINQPVDARGTVNRKTLHDHYSSLQTETAPALITGGSREAKQALFDQFGISQPYIVLGIGGGRNADWRFWPAENFAELIRLNPDRQWILMGGGEDDFKQAHKIIDQCEHKNALNLVNQTSMSDAATLIHHAQVVVGNDSGIANLSAILQVPTLCIYGPTSALQTGPALNGASPLFTDIPCQPCFQEPEHNPKTASQCTHRDCLKQLSAERVNVELQRLLTLQKK